MAIKLEDDVGIFESVAKQKQSSLKLEDDRGIFEFGGEKTQGAGATGSWVPLSERKLYFEKPSEMTEFETIKQDVLKFAQDRGIIPSPKVFETLGLKGTREKEIARAKNMYAVSEETGISLSDVRENYDDIMEKEYGMITPVKQNEKQMQMMMAGGALIGLGVSPVAFVFNIGKYVATSETLKRTAFPAIEAIRKTVTGKPYEYKKVGLKEAVGVKTAGAQMGADIAELVLTGAVMKGAERAIVRPLLTKTFDTAIKKLVSAGWVQPEKAGAFKIDPKLLKTLVKGTPLEKAIAQYLKVRQAKVPPKKMTFEPPTMIEKPPKLIEKAVEVVPPKAPIKAPKAGGKVQKPADQNLIQEAKKFKTADEFVESFRKEKKEYAMQHRPSESGSGFDLTNRDAIPEDIYTHPEYYSDMKDITYKESYKSILSMEGKPEKIVTIYRASPRSEFKNGDWVSLSKEYAKQSGYDDLGKGKDAPVRSMKVKAKDIQFAGDDINEFGYFPTEKTLTEIWEQAHAPEIVARGDIYRISESTKVTNTQGKEVALPKGEEYTVFKLADGKIRLQDGKQVTIYEGELGKIKGDILKAGEQPKAGGRVPKPFNLLGQIKKDGGLDPESIKKAGYNVDEDFKQFGLTSALKKGGMKIDSYASELVELGQLQVEIGESPTDALVRTLKEKTARITKTEASMERTIEKEERAFYKEQEELMKAEERARTKFVDKPKKPLAGKAVKTAIQKVTGIKKDVEIIKQKEDISLRRKLKTEARGARIGFKAGKREVLRRRSTLIKGVQEVYNLTDADLKKIIHNRNFGIMSNFEFKNFIDNVRVEASKIEIQKQAMNELVSHIQEKELNVDNLRKSMKLPTFKNMTTENIRKLDEALEPFQKGDEFLSVRKLEVVDRAIELRGVKTYREVRERLAKETGVPVEELEKIRVHELDRFRWDSPLARRNPFYRMMVEKVAEKLMISNMEYLELEKGLLKIAKKLKPKGFIAKIIPQQKNIFKFMETPLAEKHTISLTETELEIAKYMTKHFVSAREYLIKVEAMKQGRENYFTHIRRGILEAVKEDGIIKASKEVFTAYKQEEQGFNILDQQTGEILALDKYFKFAMHRTGVIKPSENVIRSFLQYMKTLKKKQALDELVGLIDIYAHSLTPTGLTKKGVLLHSNMIRFVKEWLNTKKGRHVTLIAKQNGVIDGVLRAIKTFTSLRDLGINIPVSIATEVGEQVTTFQLLGKIKFAKGKVRQNTKKGKRILKKYEEFIGKNPWKELIEPSKDIGDRLMEGIFILFRDASVRANKTFLLGSLTIEEFQSGEISMKRLASLRTELGRYRMIVGSKSIIGATPEGRSYTQYKTWALPILSTTVKNLGNVSIKLFDKKIAWSEKKQSMRELYRLIEVTAFVMIIAMMIRDKDKEKNTFTGKLISKIYNESMTLIQALDPKMFLSAGRSASFAAKLGSNLKMLLLGERYKTTKKLKGVAGLKRQITPVAISQFKGKPKPTRKSRFLKSKTRRTSRTKSRFRKR